jgi:hypothetical protein
MDGAFGAMQFDAPLVSAPHLACAMNRLCVAAKSMASYQRAHRSQIPKQTLIRLHPRVHHPGSSSSARSVASSYGYCTYLRYVPASTRDAIGIYQHELSYQT